MKRKKTKIKKRSNTCDQKGVAAIFITILILTIVLNLAVSIATLAYGQRKIDKYVSLSSQVYFAAEAGIEDILLRLVENKTFQSSYQFDVDSSATDVSVSNIIGGSRTITSIGSNSNLDRKVEVVYQVSSIDVSFRYGVQAGDLGIQMDSNSNIHGNVFSNGPITGTVNNKIHGDVVSAGASGRIEAINIVSDEGGGSAWARDLEDCNIAEDAHYTNMINCTVGGSHYTPEDGGDLREMPLTDAQITDWTEDAKDGGTYPGGDYTLAGGEDTLGPIKVDGNMTLNSNSILTVAGTIWVTGDLELNSNAILKLDPSFGSFSGVIVVDGHIFLDSNILICGSEGEGIGLQCNPSVGSYLMLLSTNSSVDPLDPAIEAKSNTQTGILYAANGIIKLTSNAWLREATGYGIYMDSNAELIYEIGLADAKFTSGPGGSWEVFSWKEVE